MGRPIPNATDRQTTDEDGNAYRLKVENIAGSKFSVDMAYATKDVENERSGFAKVHGQEVSKRRLTAPRC